MKIKLITVMCAVLSTSVWAQITSDSTRIDSTKLTLKKSSFSVITGVPNVSGTNMMLADARILLNNPSFGEGYGNLSPYSYTYSYFSYALQGSFDLQGSEIFEKARPQIRFSLGFANFALSAANFTKRQLMVTDTLISQSTGQVFYKDSTVVENYQVDQRIKTAMVNAALILRTSSWGRWHLYTGLGVGLGAVIRAETEATPSRFAEVGFRQEEKQMFNDFTTYTSINENRSDLYAKNRGSFTGSIYVPLGISARLSNGQSWLSRMSVLVEIQPGVMYNRIPELRQSTVNAMIPVHFGLQLSL